MGMSKLNYEKTQIRIGRGRRNSWKGTETSLECQARAQALGYRIESHIVAWEIWNSPEKNRITTYLSDGDIIAQKCRRCYYNRSDDASFSINICANCPTGSGSYGQLGAVILIRAETAPQGNLEYSGWIDASRVRELNDQGIPDKEISLSVNEVHPNIGKVKK